MHQSWGWMRCQLFLFLEADIFTFPWDFQFTSPSGNMGQLLEIGYGHLSRWNICHFQTGELSVRAWYTTLSFPAVEARVMEEAHELWSFLDCRLAVQRTPALKSLPSSPWTLWEREISICFARSLRFGGGLFVTQHNLTYPIWYTFESRLSFSKPHGASPASPNLQQRMADACSQEGSQVVWGGTSGGQYKA